MIYYFEDDEELTYKGVQLRNQKRTVHSAAQVPGNVPAFRNFRARFQ